jgi:hypothetical protein
LIRIARRSVYQALHIKDGGKNVFCKKLLSVRFSVQTVTGYCIGKREMRVRPVSCTHKPMRTLPRGAWEKLTELNRDYIAGYFDGEGCIQIEQDGSLCCRIKSAYKPVLIELQAQFGGSLSPEIKTNLHHKQLWRWRIKCNEAEGFLRDIAPLLREKGEQARIAITYQDIRNSTRGIHSTNERQDEQRKLVACTRQKLSELKKQ